MSVNPEGLIEIALGTYFSLLGFGAIRASKNTTKDSEWRSKYGAILKVAGPLVLLFGLATTFRLLK